MKAYKIYSLFVISLTSSWSFAGQPVPAPACAEVTAAAKLRGIDVSDNQKETVWTTIKTSGVRFAFVKATEGRGFVNKEFQSAWEKLPEAGILRGAYHYFKAADDPEQQANFYLEKVGQAGENDLPALLDLEERGEVPAEVLLERVKIWLERVERATGKTPVIYTGYYFWQSLGNPPGFDRYPLFIADVTGAPCPKVPAPWKR